MNEMGIMIGEETNLKELILSIYEILKDDISWHFFWEEAFVTVRFSSEYGDKFTDFIIEELEDYTLVSFEEDDKTTFIKEWVDSSKYVEMYKEYFTLLFHMNTMMAINFIKNDSYDRFTMKNIIDRMVHSLMNMSFPAYAEDMGKSNPSNYEASMLSAVALDRAFYGGYLQYYGDYIKDTKYDTKQDS